VQLVVVFVVVHFAFVEELHVRVMLDDDEDVNGETFPLKVYLVGNRLIQQ
jgi:hypothetical protein